MIRSLQPSIIDSRTENNRVLYAEGGALLRVRLSHKAEKELVRLNEPIRGRIVNALDALEYVKPKGDIKPLVGSLYSRVRVGNYRILFLIDDDEIRVHSIQPRGQAYKGRRK